MEKLCFYKLIFEEGLQGRDQEGSCIYIYNIYVKFNQVPACFWMPYTYIYIRDPPTTLFESAISWKLDGKL